MKPITSALPRLYPTQIVSKTTGEILTWDEYQSQALRPLLGWVLSETQRLYNQDPSGVHTASAGLKHNPAEYARQQGYRVDYETLARGVKAKSRLEKLVQHKLLSETASYERNPNPRKQPHKFSKTINLGATDKQMVTLERENDLLILSWKCWDDEYGLVFKIPGYVLERDITKWSLPLVSDKGFIFTTQESPHPASGTNIAGVDLGRVEPFTLAILNQNKSLIAQYTSNNQVNRVNRKRENLLKESKHLLTKAIALESLGETERAHKLRAQRTLKRNKASRLTSTLVNQLAADLVGKATRHNVSLIRLEDLRWATGARYGSKWTHGQVSNKLEHSAARKGIATKRVNPRRTSQTCHECKTPITHNTKTRTVRCEECKSRLDRDMNAALNIAKATKNTMVQPASRVLVGTGVALSQPVVTKPQSVSDSLNPVLTRLTA